MTEEAWHTRSDIWKAAHAHIKPELLPFIILAPQDVREMTEEALRAADPALKLGELLNSRGLAKKTVQDLHNEARKREDIQRIKEIWRWPMPYLPLKTQPWITNAEGRMRFARIHCTELLTVLEEGKPPVKFTSIEQIVETWSVD